MTSHLNTIRLLMALAMVPGDRKLIGDTHPRLCERDIYTNLPLRTDAQGFRVDFFVSGNVGGMTVKGREAVTFMAKLRQDMPRGLDVIGLDGRSYTFGYHSTPSYEQLKMKLSREGVVFPPTKEGQEEKTRLMVSVLAKFFAAMLRNVGEFDDALTMRKSA